MSVEATESSEHSGALYVKGNILKSYTGSVSRPATILFVNNILVKVYCGCSCRQKWSVLPCNSTSDSTFTIVRTRNFIFTGHVPKSFRNGIRRRIQLLKEQRLKLS